MFPYVKVTATLFLGVPGMGAPTGGGGTDNPSAISLDLLDLLRKIEAVREAHVAQIRDPAKIVRIQVETEIECPHQARSIADLPRAVPRPGAIRHAEIGRNTDEPDIDLIERPCQRRTHGRLSICDPARIGAGIPKEETWAAEATSRRPALLCETNLFHDYRV